MRGKSEPDPQGAVNTVRWACEGTLNSSKGIFELVANLNTRTFYHFLFKS